MSHELPKNYDPSAIEPRWAEYWEKEKLFHVETPPKDLAQAPFTILLPPPNVTGNLHMGHMFEHTESDILVRWRRMRGRWRSQSRMRHPVPPRRPQRRW